ncbi:MAG: DUF3021 domain-containing protein [Ruminococcaceae bacterium]|nr:DUF3021 domain-containing protein [Oscillospiraceae bacterium]
MRFLSEFLKMFSYVTSGTAIAFAAYTLIVGYDMVYTYSVAEIPLVGIIVSLITTLTIQREYKTAKGQIAAFICHYIFISVIMVVLGILFEWVRPVPGEIILMLICVVFVYAFSAAMFFISMKRDAKKINKALKERFEANN